MRGESECLPAEAIKAEAVKRLRTYGFDKEEANKLAAINLTEVQGRKALVGLIASRDKCALVPLLLLWMGKRPLAGSELRSLIGQAAACNTAGLAPEDAEVKARRIIAALLAPTGQSCLTFSECALFGGFMGIQEWGELGVEKEERSRVNWQSICNDYDELLRLRRTERLKARWEAIWNDYYGPGPCDWTIRGWKRIFDDFQSQSTFDPYPVSEWARKVRSAAAELKIALELAAPPVRKRSCGGL